MNNDNNLEFCIAGVNCRAGYATAYSTFCHRRTGLEILGGGGGGERLGVHGRKVEK